MFALQAYVQKQAQSLLDIQGMSDCNLSSLVPTLQQWRIEMTALYLCFCIGGPKTKAALLALNMEDGTSHEACMPSCASPELLVSATACHCFAAVLLHRMIVVAA